MRARQASQQERASRAAAEQLQAERLHIEEERRLLQQQRQEMVSVDICVFVCRVCVCVRLGVLVYGCSGVWACGCVSVWVCLVVFLFVLVCACLCV